uniref:MFS domain-containing protein n=1 Tax=Schistocephalus solidus TaxID=70667 RepID=A0A183TCY0_SCHSO
LKARLPYKHSSINLEEADHRVSNLSQKIVPSNSSAQFTDSVEAEYKMRIPKNAKPLLKPLNIEKRTSKSGKILITIPTLEESNSMKQKPSTNLLDLLPPTRALIVREGNTPMMIPHQLAKPKAPESLVKQHQQRQHAAAQLKSANLSLPEDDEDEFIVDDDDTEEVTGKSKYFSFYDAKKEAERLTVLAQTTATSPSAVPSSSNSSSSGTASRISTSAPSHVSTPSSAPPGLPILPSKPFADEDLPEPGKRPAEHSVQDSNQVSDGEEPEPVWTEASFIPAPERKRARLGGCGQTQIGAGSSAIMDVIASAKSGIRSVSQDELTDGAQLELLKSITSDNRPRKVDAEQPNKLAFRKHQITWLAYMVSGFTYALMPKTLT